MSDGAATRRRAAEAVAAVAGGRSLSDVLPPLLDSLSARDRGLVQELAYGTVRWQLRIDAWLAALMERRAGSAYVHALLAVGLYQVRFTRVAPHAAVAATVSAAPKKMRGLVNAVLRNAQRRADELDAIADNDPVASSAHPWWLLERLHADWPDDAEAIIAANNEPAPMTLRARDRDAYLAALAAAGIGATAAPHTRDGIVLDQPAAVAALPGFGDGIVSVQDAAAQLAADVVGAAAGMRVLDACAAPGGKACHLLERTPDLAELVAVERDVLRLARVYENLARLRLDARVVIGDATQPGEWWDGQPFDRILLDAPCSATGVIRRHPDIRLLRRADDIDVLARCQCALLDALWPLLAPGGRFVYATCSVLAAENDAVVAAFLHAHPDAAVEPIAADWGRTTALGRQVLPGQDGMDGFYYACLRHVDPR